MGFDIDLGGVAGKALSAIIAVTVVLLVVAEVLPDLFTATGDINNVFDANATDLNSTAAANIAGVFPLIIGVVVIFGILALITGAVRTRL